jgi:hypothetical protein
MKPVGALAATIAIFAGKTFATVIFFYTILCAPARFMPVEPAVLKRATLDDTGFDVSPAQIVAAIGSAPSASNPQPPPPTPATPQTPSPPVMTLEPPTGLTVRPL